MNQNKQYKKYIYNLCLRAYLGERLAFDKLQNECQKNTQAVWAVKHWKKLRKRRQQGSAKVKGTLGSMTYQRTSSKPFQGRL